MWQPRCLSCDERREVTVSHDCLWKRWSYQGLQAAAESAPFIRLFHLQLPACALNCYRIWLLMKNIFLWPGHVSIDFSPQRRQSTWQNLPHYRLQITILNCNQGHIRLDCSTAATHNLCLTPRRHTQCHLYVCVDVLGVFFMRGNRIMGFFMW